MNQIKCLEYYMDSKIYSPKEVEENIEETKKDFTNKQIQVEITLNEFGMYIITFYFRNKNTIFQKIRLYLKKKRKKPLLLEEKTKTNKKEKRKNTNRLEKYYGHSYGKYKKTGTYKPY